MSNVEINVNNASQPNENNSLTDTLFNGNNLVKISSHYSEGAQIVLHHGESLQFLKTIPANSLNLIISSPPYNIGKIYEKRVGIDQYLSWHEHGIQEFLRVLKQDGSVCWQVGNYVDNGEVFPLDIYFYQIFKKFGFKLRNRIIWHFGHGLHASKRFSGRYETILWFTKSEHYKFNLDNVRVPQKYPGKREYKGHNRGAPSCNPKGKNPSDIWQVLTNDWDTCVWDIPNVKSNHPEKTLHPCQFPIELVERCVLALTDEGEIVFDPYCGVGSALIAALKNGRRAIGCDKEEQYINITKQRLKDYFAGRLKTRPMGKPVFVPTGKEKVSQIPAEWRRELKDHENSGNLLFQ